MMKVTVIVTKLIVIVIQSSNKSQNRGDDNKRHGCIITFSTLRHYQNY